MSKFKIQCPHCKKEIIYTSEDVRFVKTGWWIWAKDEPRIACTCERYCVADFVSENARFITVMGRRCEVPPIPYCKPSRKAWSTSRFLEMTYFERASRNYWNLNYEYIDTYQEYTNPNTAWLFARYLENSKLIRFEIFEDVNYPKELDKLAKVPKLEAAYQKTIDNWRESKNV